MEMWGCIQVPHSPRGLLQSMGQYTWVTLLQLGHRQTCWSHIPMPLEEHRLPLALNLVGLSRPPASIIQPPALSG